MADDNNAERLSQMVWEHNNAVLERIKARDRSRQLAELVTKTNAMFENLKDRGLFKEVGPDHPSFDIDYDDDDEPDYLDLIRSVARGAAT
jgi:hypothetical protein